MFILNVKELNISEKYKRDEHGEYYTTEDLSKQEAELLCEQMTADLKDNYVYDWHYNAGRVRVLRLDKNHFSLN